MTKNEYLKDSDVTSFINWIETKLHSPGSFVHAYQSLKPKGDWQCDSIYSAYDKYTWSFNCTNHTTKRPEKGNSFTDSLELLKQYSIGLRESVANSLDDACQKHCFSILAWGGVLPKNKPRVEKLSSDGSLSSYLQKVKVRLNPETFDTMDGYDGIEMNAGFTKIYSLLIDDFVIYDGRVGAALGLLVRLFAEERQLTTIPKPLLFAYGDSRPVKADKIAKGQNRRNPSTALFKFHTTGH